jgi:RNA polymerase sigma-70 factor (ECF subfamily)
MGNDGELDDIVQETFVDAMDALQSLREPSEVRRWLVTIAVRRAYRALARSRRRRWFGFQLAEVSPKSGDRRDSEPAHALYEALDKLSPDLRVPWVLHRIEQESLPEVARLCDVSLATIKRRIADADERLKRRLDGT